MMPHVSFSYVQGLQISRVKRYELLSAVSGDKWNQVKPQMGGSCRSWLTFPGNISNGSASFLIITSLLLFCEYHTLTLLHKARWTIRGFECRPVWDMVYIPESKLLGLGHSDLHNRHTYKLSEPAFFLIYICGIRDRLFLQSFFPSSIGQLLSIIPINMKEKLIARDGLVF